jgi:hypothetical protein
MNSSPFFCHDIKEVMKENDALKKDLEELEVKFTLDKKGYIEE